MTRKRGRVDEIGYWSEVKLDIIRDYAAAYSRILSARRNPSFYHLYVDAFSGAGYHVSKSTGDLVPGSATNALKLEPPFREYHFIDLDAQRVGELRHAVGNHPDVHVYAEDCNVVLPRDVLPLCRRREYRRALWLLDPYSYHYHWWVIEAAGREGSIELFLNFPIMAIHRTVGQRDRGRVLPASKEHMALFSGDDSWEGVIYSAESSLFLEHPNKATGRSIVDAYRQRLRTVAGFSHVSEPVGMRNTAGNLIYYLLFAAQKPVAAKIVRDIFGKYQGKGSPCP